MWKKSHTSIMNLKAMKETIALLNNNPLCSKCIENQLGRVYRTIMSRLWSYLEFGVIGRKKKKCKKCKRYGYVYFLTKKGRALV